MVDRKKPNNLPSRLTQQQNNLQIAAYNVPITLQIFCFILGNQKRTNRECENISLVFWNPVEKAIPPRVIGEGVFTLSRAYINQQIIQMFCQNNFFKKKKKEK